MTAVAGIDGVAVALVVAASLLVSCSSDESSGAERDDGPSTTERSRASELAERLGCDEITDPAGPAHGGWLERDVRDCTYRDGVQVRIYASLTEPQRAAAVRLLASEGEGEAEQTGCYVSGTGGIFVVAGDAWVAVVTGESGARQVADRLDGRVQPGQLDPPVSYHVFGCLPGGPP